MAYTVQGIITDLQNDPKTLARKVHLQIAGGGNTTNHGIAIFTVTLGEAVVKGFTTGLSGKLGIQKKRQYARLLIKPNRDGDLESDEFRAYYCAMVNANPNKRGVAQTHYALPNPPKSNESTLFITSRLSGCHFAVGSNAVGALLVSHIQPDMNIKGTNTITERQMRNTDMDNVIKSGGMGNVSGNFRKQQEYPDSAAIFGRYHNNAWEFYGQGQNFVTNLIITSVSVI